MVDATRCPSQPGCSPRIRRDSVAELACQWTTLRWQTASLLLLLAAMLLFAGNRNAWADPSEGDPLVRELFVPFADLDVVLKVGGRRVFLTRAEYDDLIRRAGVSTEAPAPQPTALLSAQYVGKVDGPRAIVRGELLIDVTASGVHAIPLPLHGVGLLRATLDDRPAAISEAGEGDSQLFVEGRGRHRLLLDLVAPVEVAAAQQTLAFQLPYANSGRFRLTVPGNVDVKRGVDLLRRTTSAGLDQTEFEFLLNREPTTMVMSLNDLQADEGSVVVAHTVLLDELTETYERLHVTASLDVRHGASERFRFVVPRGFDIIDASTSLLSRWQVVAEEDRQVLVVQLREPAAGTQVLSISAQRNAPDLTDWRMPNLQPLDVAGTASVVGLVVDERLETRSVAFQGLIPIDIAALTATLPPSIFTAEPGAPAVAPVVAYYAPDNSFDLTADFRRPAGELRVASNLVLVVRDAGWQLHGGFTLTPLAERTFGCSLLFDDAWQVKSVRHEQEELDFEQHDDVDGRTRLRVKLPSAVEPGRSFTFHIDANYTPVDWLSDWQSRQLVFPNVEVVEATVHEGAIAVRAEDDMRVRAQQLVGLTLLDAAEKVRYGLAEVDTDAALRFDAAPVAATLELQRVPPRITAETYTFLRIEPGQLSAHYELVYDIADARTRELAFYLPLETPAEISIQGLDGVAVKESTSVVDDVGRRWVVTLAASAWGVVRLQATLEQPLNLDYAAAASGDQQPADLLSLPVVRATEVSYQTGSIAVEGSPELEVSLASEARRIDVGELIDAHYQPGRRLLGAFGFVGEPAAITASVSKPTQYGLPAALVERAEFVSSFSASGIGQTAARFHLRTKAQFLEVQLPTDSALWSAYLDGVPAKPQRNDARMLISMPGKRDVVLRDLQLVYETPVRKVGLWGDLELGTPRLFLSEAPDSPAVEVPLADLAWYVSLPPGYRLAATHGTVFPDLRDQHTQLQLAERKTPAEALAIAFTQKGYGAWGAQAAAPTNVWYAARAVGQSGGAAQRETEELRQLVSSTVSPDSWSNMSAGQSGPDPNVAFSADEQSIAFDAAESLAEGDPFGVPRFGAASTADQTFDSRPRQANPPVAEPNGELFGQDAPQLAQQASPPDRALRGGSFPSAGNAGLVATGSRDSSVKLWALEGLRSLKIDLSVGEGKMAFRSLGADPLLDITVVEQQRLELLAWGAALLVLAGGLALAGSSLRARGAYVLLVLLLATLIPLATGWQRELGRLLDLTFMAGVVLIPIYLATAFIRNCASLLRRTPKISSAAVLAGLLIVLPSTSWAQEETEAQVGPIRVKLIGPDRPVVVPDDVVIVPYDPAAPPGASGPAKVIVPYQKYVELWDLAYPDRGLLTVPPPAEFAWAGATWRTSLDAEETLLLEGVLEFETYVDELTAIPLSISGGVIEKATMDGQPARIVSDADFHTSTRDADAPQQRVATTRQEESARTMLLASASGPHRLELAIRYRLSRRGGWRSVDGIVPQSPASTLIIDVPLANTQLRLSATTDRSEYETSRDGEQIETTLGTGGRLQLQWRPKVASAEVDRSLTLQSDAVLDVQEDSLRMVWRLDLLFPRSARDVFTLGVDADYIVEQVLGDNVRGWQRDGNTVKVALLSPVRDRQRLTLRMTRRGAVGAGELRTFQTPLVQVPEAVLHEGRLAVRRSPLLELRVEQLAGVARTDLDAVETARDVGSESPLGVRPFQAYRFARSPFQLGFSAAPVRERVAAEVQSLLRISEDSRSLESRILLRAESRPVHQVDVQLPEGFQLTDVLAPGTYHWSIADDAVAGTRLTVYLGAGAIGEFSLVLRGDLRFDSNTGADQAGTMQVLLPRLVVDNVFRHETYIVVQTDPSHDARAEQLQDCQSVLLQQAYGWLDEEQRRLARLVLHAPASNFSGAVRLQRRESRVSCRTVSNLRITSRAFEELILLDFNIKDAGTREVAFLLPADLRDARIKAPLLLEKTIEDVSAEQIRVRLSLQDEVIGQLRVLVENDRLITADEQSVPIPIVETGRVQAQFVALESAGRDEVVVARTNEVTPLSRQQSQWQVLATLLGDQVTQAFLVSPNAQAPRIVVQNKDRQAVQTVGARIAFAETVLVVDAGGAYRGSQVYQVDNRTEQFLEVVLPPGARLWTARVAGEPVKPMAGDNTVRVPLVKTAEGDQDYRVILKYGGRLEELGQLSTVSFPLIKARNINVEESQVRLRLPEQFRWFDFGGTMRNVKQEEDLVAGYLQYKTQQLYACAAGLTAQNAFARARSANNLKNLVTELETFDADKYQTRANQSLRQQLDSNRRALEMGKRQLQEQVQAAGVDALSLSNSGRIASLYDNQSNEISRKAFSDVGANFDVAEQARGQAPNEDATAGQLQQGWIEGNQLANSVNGTKVLDDRLNLGRSPQMLGKKSLGQRGNTPTVSDETLVPSARLPEYAQEKEIREEIRRGRSDSDKVERFQQQLESRNYYRDADGDVDGYAAEGYGDGKASGPDFKANNDATSGYGSGMMGGGMMQGDGVAAADGGYGGGFGGHGGGGGYGGGYGASPDAAPSDMEEARGLGVGGQLGDDLSRGSGLGGAAASQTSAVPTPMSGGVAILGESAGAVKSPATGLASLDVALPVRGVEFLFTTPRGDVEITARPLEASLVSRLIRLAAILGVVVVISLGYRVVQRVGFDRIFSRLICLLLLASGVVMLVLGAAPLLALVLMLFAVVQFVRRSMAGASVVAAAHVG